MKAIVTIICTICLALNVFSQGVGIGTTSPNSSAMLDVQSTDKGLLIPRMSAAQRDAIVSPETGLLIFCTDDNLYYSNKGTPASPDWTILNSKWLRNGSNIYFSEGNVGIGISTPEVALSVANTSLGGLGTTGSFQIGPTNSYNLVLDNNEVQSRYDGGSNTLFLQYWGGDITACASGGTTNVYGWLICIPTLMYPEELELKQTHRMICI